MKTLTCGVLLLAAALGRPGGAGEVDVVNVVVRQSTAGVYRFDVTPRHADEGWDHDADGWEIRDGDGSVRATRVPAHPHFNEQPFTRAPRRARLPARFTSVTVAGHDSEHGYGVTEITLDLPQSWFSQTLTAAMQTLREPGCRWG